jgi:type IV pilus assembly protein PilQ
VIDLHLLNFKQFILFVVMVTTHCVLGQSYCLAEGGELVSLNVINAEVRDVLISLAKLGDRNIIVDDSIKGKITIQMQSLDFDTALELITQTKGLHYQCIGNVIIVGGRDVINQNFGSLHIYSLNYIEPTEVLKSAELALGTLSNGVKAEKSAKPEEKGTEHSRLSVDVATNSLLFYGTESEASQIRRMLDNIDIPYQQVSLEAKVVAIHKDAAKKLGVEWEWSKFPQTPEYENSTETSTSTVWNSATNSYENVTQTVPTTKVTRVWKDGSESVPGVIQFGHGANGHPFELYYAAKLNALVSDGKANILAKPNIIAINGKQAVINIGGEVPVPTVATTNSTTTTSIKYREAGIILKYTPRINRDGYITATVHTEVSSPSYVADLKAYKFNKRSADTIVRLKDGETMVIGGLIGSEESKTINKIPFLGDLPILGRFFSNIDNSKSETEVMIFLTANIVK